jgi:hypothetical protein
MPAAEVPAAAVPADVLPAAALAEDLPSAVVPPSVEADVPPVSAAAVPVAAAAQEDAEDNIQCIKKQFHQKGEAAFSLLSLS